MAQRNPRQRSKTTALGRREPEPEPEPRERGNLSSYLPFHNAKDSALPESARCGTSLSLSRTLPFKRLSGSGGTSSMTSVHSRHATSSQRLSTFRIRGARDVVPDNYSNCRSGATIRIKETLPRYRGPGSASETNDGI